MAKYNIKKVPRGFSFPISKKEMKLGLSTVENFIYLVNFMDISSSEQRPRIIEDRFWVGIVTAWRVEDKWGFEIEINALRDKNILFSKELITKILLKDIVSWINKKRTLLLTSPVEPSQLFLSFTNKNGNICSRSHEVRNG